MNKVQNLIWKFNYAIYPYLRNFILFAGLWKHSGRQEFYIGRVARPVAAEEVADILKTAGFECSICSWIDDGEILGMRRREGKCQYHVRYFCDGELRGHYEYSPEGSPIGHLRGRVLESKREYFIQILDKINSEIK